LLVGLKSLNLEDRYAPPSLEVVSSRFEQFGFPLIVDETIIPDDDTTLFVCSGMQRVRNRFLTPNGTKHGSLQSCIRTNDLELVGDGSHLTYFQMLGNFSFGGDYEQSIELWTSLLTDLSISVEPIHVHPDSGHHSLWQKRGYETVDDQSCVWSDGQIGGYCCEIYSRGLEIGNLVNTLGHSTDVGFGWERLFLIVEGQERVDQTSLFRKDVHPVVADYCRTLEVLWKNGVVPGTKHRNYVCRRLLRRMLRYLNGSERFIFDEWLSQEKIQRDSRIREAKRIWRRYKDKPPEWWWTSCGILPEEIYILGS
jgi:alanyl-tRNA synthetase